MSQWKTARPSLIQNCDCVVTCWLASIFRVVGIPALPPGAESVLGKRHQTTVENISKFSEYLNASLHWHCFFQSHTFHELKVILSSLCPAQCTVLRCKWHVHNLKWLLINRNVQYSCVTPNAHVTWKTESKYMPSSFYTSRLWFLPLVLNVPWDDLWPIRIGQTVPVVFMNVK